MNTYKLIMFDLDGTLTDPKEGITRSIQYALCKMGYPEPDPDYLVSFIGPPLLESFKGFYSLSDLQAQEAVKLYREYYSRSGIFENKLYPGISPLLNQLHREGRSIVLATSKPTIFAKQILRHFNLIGFFSHVAGSNLDGSMVEKAAIIDHVIKKFPDFAKSEMLMVGDRCFDIEGAISNGIDSAAVTYGYGSIKELSRANPKFMVNSVEELAAKVLKR